MDKTLNEILTVSARASDWERRESNNSSLAALKREYDEMAFGKKSEPPPRNLAITVFWSDEDSEFIARCDEYPSLSGLAKTRTNALRELAMAIDLAESVQEVTPPFGALAELHKRDMVEFWPLENLRRAVLTGDIKNKYIPVPKLILLRLDFDLSDIKYDWVVNGTDRHNVDYIYFANINTGGSRPESRKVILRAIEDLANEILEYNSKSEQTNRDAPTYLLKKEIHRLANANPGPYNPKSINDFDLFSKLAQLDQFHRIVIGGRGAIMVPICIIKELADFNPKDDKWMADYYDTNRNEMRFTHLKTRESCVLPKKTVLKVIEAIATEFLTGCRQKSSDQ